MHIEVSSRDTSLAWPALLFPQLPKWTTCQWSWGSHGFTCISYRCVKQSVSYRRAAHEKVSTKNLVIRRPLSQGLLLPMHIDIMLPTSSLDETRPIRWTRYNHERDFFAHQKSVVPSVWSQQKLQQNNYRLTFWSHCLDLRHPRDTRKTFSSIHSSVFDCSV